LQIIKNKMKTITKKILPIVLALGVGVGGCMLDALPYNAQPGFHRDAKERWAREREESEKSRNQYNSNTRHGRIPQKCNKWLTNNPNDLRTRPENTIRNKSGDWIPAQGYIWSEPNNLKNNVCTIKIN